jgi:DNA-binding NarL/FixJ family response regulator
MSLYVIDDHPMMRQAIAMLLRRIFSATTVVEVARFSDLAAATIKNGDPRLLVLDLLLPGVKDTNAVREIKTMYPDVPLVVLSSMPARDAQESCMSAGADLYIEKSTPVNEISSAILKLVAKDDHEETNLSSNEVKLTSRQKQLLGMLDRGLSNRDIATELDISEHTVKVHLWRLFRRLNVKSRTQTLHYARINGLL